MRKEMLFLEDLSNRLLDSQEEILIANTLDIQENPQLNPGLVDRLKLNPQNSNHGFFLFRFNTL